MLARPLAIVGLIQTIWIVDANNGPGTNFTDLPAAVAAAASGDTILVQSGTYSAFNVTAVARRDLSEMGAPGIEPGTYGLKTTPSTPTASEAPSGALSGH